MNAAEFRALASDLIDSKGKTMDQWDQIRRQVETHKGSDLPRLNFESLMEDISEKIVEAAARIEWLEAALREIDAAVTAFGQSIGAAQSLAYQKHEPSWQAWKRLCDLLAANHQQSPPHAKRDEMKAAC